MTTLPETRRRESCVLFEKGQPPLVSADPPGSAQEFVHDGQAATRLLMLVVVALATVTCIFAYVGPWIVRTVAGWAAR